MSRFVVEVPPARWLCRCWSRGRRREGGGGAARASPPLLVATLAKLRVNFVGKTIGPAAIGVLDSFLDEKERPRVSWKDACRRDPAFGGRPAGEKVLVVLQRHPKRRTATASFISLNPHERAARQMSCTSTSFSTTPLVRISNQQDSKREQRGHGSANPAMPPGARRSMRSASSATPRSLGRPEGTK